MEFLVRLHLIMACIQRTYFKAEMGKSKCTIKIRNDQCQSVNFLNTMYINVIKSIKKVKCSLISRGTVP